MNTIRSVGYGWGVLILAGGGAYYFAKRSINADRAERAAAETDRRRRNEQMRYAERTSSPSSSSSSKINSQSNPSTSGSISQAVSSGLGLSTGQSAGGTSDDAGNPSQEASHDPAPTRHAPENEGQKAQEKSKYESTEPFRSRKGDRFS